MLFERLLDDLKLDEGFRGRPYQDIYGRWTIGFGSTFILGARVTAKTRPVSYSAALDLLMIGAYSAAINCQGIYANFNQLDDVRQEVLVNMAYNLGGRGLGLFVDLKTAILQHNFNGARDAMIDSRWYRQVTNRAERLVQRMLSGNDFYSGG